MCRALCRLFGASLFGAVSGRRGRCIAVGLWLDARLARGTWLAGTHGRSLCIRIGGSSGMSCLFAGLPLCRFDETTVVRDLWMRVYVAVGGIFLRAQTLITFPVAFGLALAVQLFLLGALAVAVCLAGTVLLFLLFTLAIDFALRLGQHPQIVFRVLGVVFSIHTVVRQLRVPVKLIVFFDNLLRRTPHLTLWPGAVKNPVNDAAARWAICVAVLVAPRP